MKFMNELIFQGYEREYLLWILENAGIITYHVVYNPNKPGKICIVFKLSVEFHKISINKNLLSGPDLTKKIVWVLLRFMKKQITVQGLAWRKGDSPHPCYHPP